MYLKRILVLALCLLPALALAVPPYPTVWYREQTVRNKRDIESLQAATVVRESEATASEALVGALRYRVDGTNAYLEAVMQTGTNSWEWTVLKTNNWAE